MGTYITEDFEVPAREVRRYAMNSDNNRASAFIIGDWNAIQGQVYYEPTVINRGELNLESGGLIAGSFFDYNSGMSWANAVFENHGIIRAVLPDIIWARVLNANGAAPHIRNFGTLIAEARDDATVMRISDGRTITNGPDALLRADANGRAVAIEVQNGITIVNQGRILVHVRGGTSFPDAEGATAIYSRTGSINLDNSGIIQATGARPDQITEAISTAIEVSLDIINSGIISAHDAISMRDNGNLPQGRVSTIANSGLIDGNITLVGGLDTIINTGEIRGDIQLGAGDDIYDGRGGTLTGAVFGGAGSDTMRAGAEAARMFGEGGNDDLFGGENSDFLTGGLGNDNINGRGNIDTAIVSGNRSQYTITQTATGVFRLVGPDGTDTLTAIEYLQFGDQTMRLLPGTGVSVNFETADPSQYQAAMNAIRDFDGNALGGDGSWLRIGSADVDGDGDVDQILVNDAIGRFATVGGYDDGLFYFDDYSWAGETRVVGIYIDPLVASGDVVAGSANDSQRRFQNDLEIENINRVLGADDYDGDGLQEVYFALTDGTAYLHAYMHADGNIRYANYQSQQQVIDFLTANGFDASTWAGWFPSTQEPEAKDAPATALAEVAVADVPVPADRPEALWDHASWHSEEWAPRVEAFA